MREIAVAFALMTESGVTLDDLFQLYGIANQAEMVNRARCWVRSASDIIGVRQFLYAMMLLSDECYSQEALSVVSEVVKQRRRPAVGSEPIGEPKRIGRIARTGTVAQGMELSDIVEIGDLLRLAGAIDEDAAADLVGQFDPKRLAGFCARDRNLGRHEELLCGLYGASRLSCLEVVRQVYGDEIGDEALAVLLAACRTKVQRYSGDAGAEHGHR